MINGHHNVSDFSRKDLTFVFCCAYCNEILTVKGNIHRDSGLSNNYCPVDVACSL